MTGIHKFDDLDSSEINTASAEYRSLWYYYYQWKTVGDPIHLRHQHTDVAEIVYKYIYT